MYVRIVLQLLAIISDHHYHSLLISKPHITVVPKLSTALLVEELEDDSVAPAAAGVAGAAGAVGAAAGMTMI